MIHYARLFTLAALALAMSFVSSDLLAQNQFKVGGGRGQGTVRFQVGGGAGNNPQFTVGGAADARFARRRANAGFPVAVGPGGYGFGDGFGGRLFGDGGFSNLYNQGFIPVPPYFALHPPVYYSVPVPRTYGYSPFAYPPGVMTPEVSLAAPEEIINPHVQPEDDAAPPPEAKDASAKVAVSPQVILNPFVETNLTADKHQLVNTK